MNEAGQFEQPLRLKPIVSYPRVAQAGQTYLLSLDLQLASPGDWPYPEEEYPISFVLDTLPYFSYRPLGEQETSVILHRFGGTYGPAEYLLTASSQEQPPGHISIMLVNAWGIPIATLQLECEVHQQVEEAAARREIIITRPQPERQQHVEPQKELSLPPEPPVPDESAVEKVTYVNTLDEKLRQAGWIVQDDDHVDLNAGSAIAVKIPLYVAPGDDHPGAEVSIARPLPPDPAYRLTDHEYILVIQGEGIGLIEQRWISYQSLSAQLPFLAPSVMVGARFPRDPLPFSYIMNDEEIEFTNRLEPEPRSRQVFHFHRPETLAEWLRQAPAGTPNELNNLLRSRLRRMPPLQQNRLYPHQFVAIQDLERSFAAYHSHSLLQMVLQTGVTFTVGNAIYRLLKYGGARRILYVFDSPQAAGYAATVLEHFVPSEGGPPLADMYNLYHMQYNTLDADASIYITTLEQLYTVYHAYLSISDSVTGQDPLATHPGEMRYNPALPIEYFDVIIIGDCYSTTYQRWRSPIEYFDAFIVGITEEIDDRLRALFKNNVVYEQEVIEPRVLICTELSEDHPVVQTHLLNPFNVFYEGATYIRGTFSAYGYSWDVLLAEGGLDRTTSTLVIERAIRHFKPALILLIGIIGIANPRKLRSDVVVGRDLSVSPSEVSEAENVVFTGKPKLIYDRLMTLVARVANENDWLARMTIPTVSPLPSVLLHAKESTVSHIAAIQKTLEQRAADGTNQVIPAESGFDDVLQDYPDLPALEIKGLVGFVGDAEDVTSVDRAAQHASAFAFELLAEIDLTDLFQDDAQGAIQLAARVITLFQSFVKERQRLVDMLEASLRQQNDDPPAPLAQQLIDDLQAAGLSMEQVWDAYWQIKPSWPIQGARQKRLRSDIVSLLRYTSQRYNEKAILEPYADTVNRNFSAWLSSQQEPSVDGSSGAGEWKPRFHDEQVRWLERIRDRIASDLRFTMDDFDRTPFSFDGGRATARQLFGAQLEDIILELNKVLVEPPSL